MQSSRLLLYSMGVLSLTATLAGKSGEPCCGVISLDARRQSVTAIDRESAKLFSFTVKSPKVFKSIQVGDRFDMPLDQLQKGRSFAADLGVADPGEPCCGATTELGGPARPSASAPTIRAWWT